MWEPLKAKLLEVNQFQCRWNYWKTL